MQFLEQTRDILNIPNDYALVHCICADFDLGVDAVTRQFNMYYDIKKKLSDTYPGYKAYYKAKNIEGDCLKINTYNNRRVYNLVTRLDKSCNPAYWNLQMALLKLKEQIKEDNVTKITMPQLDCGVNKLDYLTVCSIIQTIFEDTDTEIVVCM